MKERDYIEYLHSLGKAEDIFDDDTDYLFLLYSELKSLSYMDSSRDIVNTELIDKLKKLADSTDKTKIENAISAVFIYHQIAEEWLYELLALTRFVIKLQLFNQRIRFEKVSEIKFSRLIKKINDTIPFEKKEQVVQYATVMNKTRNDIAHNLFKADSLENIQKQVTQFLEQNEKFSQHLDDAYEDVYETIKSYWKWSDEFIDKLRDHLTQLLEDHDIAYEAEKI